MGRIAQLRLPPDTQPKPITLDYQLGVDYTNSESNMEIHRSPNAINMIRTAKGKNEKRTGYELVKTYSGQINGFHRLGAKTLIHAGTNIYDGDTVLYSSANNAFSKSIQSKGKLYIFDGKKLLVYNGSTITSVSDSGTAYIPTIIISSPPSGGGVSLEPVNLLQSKRIVQFLGDSSTIYQLPSTAITAVNEVKSLQANGSFATLTAGTDYTVDLTLGKITFTSAKPTPVTGKDNIYVTYSKTVTGYADRINKCDICTAYGVNGARDRVFCAGNPDFPNQDWYSQIDDFTYFGDMWYSVLGRDDSAIMGYRIVNDKLATIKSTSLDGTSTYLRTGTLIDSKAAFIPSGSFQGVGAISKHSFQDLETEPIYLTEQGVFAITPSDVLGERYSQLRSYYLNGKLLQHDLRNAYSVVYNGFYMLCVDGNVYILDGTQTAREKNEPYSNRQYEAFHWNNIPARMMWVNDGLWFGDAAGNAYRFFESNGLANSYKDNGTPIYACWTTPYLFGDSFASDKTFKEIAVSLKAYVVTSLAVEANIQGFWVSILESNNKAGYFDYNFVTYPGWNYSTDTTDVLLKEKIRDIKKENKTQFRLVNDKAEPFAINRIETLYVSKR